MHRYELFECSDEAGDDLIPTGKVVELDSAWDRSNIVRAVLKAYGFTEYQDYYVKYGNVGDATIKLKYNYSGPMHWVLKKR
jgi:hypothetical protein